MQNHNTNPGPSGSVFSGQPSRRQGSYHSFSTQNSQHGQAAYQPYYNEHPANMGGSSVGYAESVVSQPYSETHMYGSPSMATAPVTVVPIPNPQPVTFIQAPAFIPQQPLVRKKTVRRNIQLTPQGNLVIDIPVPDRVLKAGRFQTGDEFTHMRYTAATCDPNDFYASGYALRQQEFNRQTELFIVVTMYNEDDELFNKTMLALMKNITHLTTRTRSKTWGSDAWKKVVVCIVSDGRKKINQRVLNVLGVMGVYQDGIMKDSVNGKDVAAHIFEYTTQLCVDTDGKARGPEKDIVPCQILFCLKEKNQKKINSHRWFFNAFAPILNPNVCILIDVGTKPTNTSLYHLWKAFDRDPHVGGACGEIYTELGTGCSNLLNPLVAAQNFEYKISNILDKPLESVMGYISVLPGAFSAYRYRALIGRPLECYFKGESMHDGDDVFAANMYLAEDRILCFELVTKQNSSWLLKYVKSAKAETDVPDGLPEFISQRRRWLNGSFFAGVHALTHWYFIFRSNHSIWRKTLLCLEFFYNFIQLLFSWFAISSFYLVFYFLAKGRVDEDRKNDPFFGQGELIFNILRQLYLVAIVSIFISSLGNRPQGSKWIYILCSLLFAIIMGVIIYLAGYTIYLVVRSTGSAFTSTGNFTKALFEKSGFRDLVISTASTYGMYLICSILYLDPWHMLTSLIQYIFLMPTFVNILGVYAFCNLHDISWGTKGDNQAPSLGGVTATQGKDGKQVVEIDFPSDKNEINSNYENFIHAMRQPKQQVKSKPDAKTRQDDYFRNFRTTTVLFWAFTNALLVVVLTNDDILNAIYRSVGFQPEGDFNPYLKFIFYSVAGLSLVRFIGSISYLIGYHFCP